MYVLVIGRLGDCGIIKEKIFSSLKFHNRPIARWPNIHIPYVKLVIVGAIVGAIVAFLLIPQLSNGPLAKTHIFLM